jgi:hypothetical protein
MISGSYNRPSRGGLFLCLVSHGPVPGTTQTHGILGLTGR